MASLLASRLTGASGFCWPPSAPSPAPGLPTRSAPKKAHVLLRRPLRVQPSSPQLEHVKSRVRSDRQWAVRGTEQPECFRSEDVRTNSALRVLARTRNFKSHSEEKKKKGKKHDGAWMRLQTLNTFDGTSFKKTHLGIANLYFTSIITKIELW